MFKTFVSKYRPIVSSLEIPKQHILISVIISTLVAIVSVGHFVPFTYDESFNYMIYAKNGFLYALTHYEYPNNHVLFSLLQGLALPDGLVQKVPNLTRLPNACYVTILCLTISYIFRSLHWALFLPALIATLFFDPEFSIYLFVARGYLLGTLILTLAALLYSREGLSKKTLLLLALSAFTVPTFAYHFTGFFLIEILSSDWKLNRFSLIRNLSIKAIQVLGMLAVMYSGIIAYVLLRGSDASIGTSALGSLEGFTNSLNQIINIGGHKYLGLLSFLLSLYACIKTWHLNTQEIRLLRCFFFSFGGYFLSVGVLGFLGYGLPFTRNGVSAHLHLHLSTIFGLYVLSTSLNGKTLYKRIIFTLSILMYAHVPAAIREIQLHFFGPKTPEQYTALNFFLHTPTPLSQYSSTNFNGNKPLEILAVNHQEVANWIYGHSYKIPINKVSNLNVDYCWVGKHIPSPELRVVLVFESGEKNICWR